MSGVCNTEAECCDTTDGRTCAPRHSSEQVHGYPGVAAMETIDLWMVDSEENEINDDLNERGLVYRQMPYICTVGTMC